MMRTFTLRTHSASTRATNLGRVVPAIAFITVLCGLVAPLHAQGFHFRGGVNLSNAALDPEPTAPNTTNMTRTYNGALIAEVGSGPVRLLLGAGYQQHGIRISGAGGGDYRLDYGTIPIMVGLGEPSVNASSSLFLNVGLEPAFLISSKRPTPATALSAEDTRDFDIAMRAELGVELPLSYSGPALVLSLGYSLGMIDVNRGENEWHNNSFHGMVGLKFRTL